MNENFPQTSLYHNYYVSKYATENDKFSYAMFVDRLSLNSLKNAVILAEIRPARIQMLGIRRFYIKMANFKNISFVTIRLGKSDKKDFTRWATEHIDDREELTQHLLDAGYKMSMSYDFEGNCYIVAVTGKENTADNANKCFTSRSSELDEAIMLTLYKHWGLAEGGSWDNISTAQDNWG